MGFRKRPTMRALSGGGALCALSRIYIYLYARGNTFFKMKFTRRTFLAIYPARACVTETFKLTKNKYIVAKL